MCIFIARPGKRININPLLLHLRLLLSPDVAETINQHSATAGGRVCSRCAPGFPIHCSEDPWLFFFHPNRPRRTRKKRRTLKRRPAQIDRRTRGATDLYPHSPGVIRGKNLLDRRPRELIRQNRKHVRGSVNIIVLDSEPTPEGYRDF